MRATAERYLSLQQVGDEIGVSDQTVRRWVKAGVLAAYKPGKEYRIKGSDLEEFLKTREVSPKVQSPLPEASAQTTQEFEQALARVLEPVRTEALQEQQAANRVLASQGERQDRVVDLAEADAGKRFLEEFPPDERPVAFGELALGYARLERDNANLREALTQAQAGLEERGQGAQEPADTVHSTNG